MSVALVEQSAGVAAVPQSKQWPRIELAAGLALTILLIAARVKALVFAGPLWRDEVQSVNWARYPVLSETWMLDSFPVLWQVVLRGWIGLGLGASDFALRGIGFVSGLLIIAALWWTGRQFGARVPWALLVLVGFNLTTILHGDAVRGYGLGVATQLLMVGCLWRTVEAPTWKNFALLQLAALLAVQAWYTNCFLLLAACVGGGLVCLRRRDWGTLGGIAAVGIVSASSMVPYALFLFPQQKEWALIIRSEYTWSWYLDTFVKALGEQMPLLVLFWFLATAGTLGLALITIASRRSLKTRPTDVDKARFLLGYLVAGTVGFWWYIRFLSVYSSVWYFLPYVTLLAICIEIGLTLWTRDVVWRQATRLGIFVAVLAVSFPATWKSLAYRFTNIDLAAQRLSQGLTSDDLVLVSPFFYGSTFERYYHGPAPWMNVPDVGHDPKTQNPYIELKRDYMPAANPIRRELQQVTETLRKGHRVWVLGTLPFLPDGQLPLQIEPAPHPTFGWSVLPYHHAWGQQIAYALQSGAAAYGPIEFPNPPQTTVNQFENVILHVFEGPRPN